MTRDDDSIGKWVRRAYAGEEGCPPPEAYLPAELAALDAADRRTLEDHADGCAACAAERELARAFEAAPRADNGAAVAGTVRRLERRPPHGRRGSGSWSTLLRLPAFQLGVAVLAVVTLGLVIRDTLVPPSLGPVPERGSMRSSSLEVVAPSGDLVAMPVEFVWVRVDGASGYRVTVRAVDDTEIWSTESETPAVAVDDALRNLLREAVWYSWTVEASDSSGRRLAWSPDVRFRVRPSGASQ